LGGAIRLPGLSFVFCAVLLQACAATSGAQAPVESTGVVIEGMVIRNELQFPVTDVMINVPATGAFAGCGNIMQRSECRTSFEAVDYAGNALVVSWKEYGKPHDTGEFVVKLPKEFDAGKPAWLEVVIFAMGQAGAKLTQ